MANPNIVNVSQIYGNTSSILISSTADPFATPLISNPAGSNKVFKINSIVVANIDGTTAVDVTVRLYSQAALGGTGTALISTASVPADASLVVMDKTTGIYLLEDKSIGAVASIANDLVITCSWEEIS
jgi:hypothetical protein